MPFAEMRKTAFAFGHNCEPPATLVGGFVVGSTNAPREVVEAERLYRAAHELELPDGFTLDMEAYQTAFQYPQAEYTAHVARHGTPKGYTGPAACGRIPWDIDRRDDLPAALDDLRTLVNYLRDRYGRHADNGLSVAFSGGKGFHVELLNPHGFIPLPHLPAVVKTLALAVARDAGVNVDQSIYHHQALFRLPNSKHAKTERYKRLLDLDDLDRLTVPIILDLAKHPAGFRVPIHFDGCELLADDLEAAERVVLKGGYQVKGQRPPPPGSPVVPKFVHDFIGFGDIQEPGREVTLFRAAAAALTEGFRLHGSEGVIRGLLEEVALKSGLDPAEVNKAIRDGMAHGAKGVSL